VSREVGIEANNDREVGIEANIENRSKLILYVATVENPYYKLVKCQG